MVKNILLGIKTKQLPKPKPKPKPGPFIGFYSILRSIGVLNLQNILKQPNVIVYNKFNEFFVFSSKKWLFSFKFTIFYFNYFLRI